VDRATKHARYRDRTTIAWPASTNGPKKEPAQLPRLAVGTPAHVARMNHPAASPRTMSHADGRWTAASSDTARSRQCLGTRSFPLTARRSAYGDSFASIDLPDVLALKRQGREQRRPCDVCDEDDDRLRAAHDVRDAGGAARLTQGRGPERSDERSGVRPGQALL
jgi:hypothetical protein